MSSPHIHSVRKEVGGRVHDLSGNFRYDTDSLCREFTKAFRQLTEAGEPFFVVRSAIQHAEVQTMLQLFRVINPDVPIIFDRWFPPDSVLLLSGTPEELDYRPALPRGRRGTWKSAKSE